MAQLPFWAQPAGPFPTQPPAQASAAAGLSLGGCCGCPEAAELLLSLFWGETAGGRLVQEGLPAEGNAVMDSSSVQLSRCEARAGPAWEEEGDGCWDFSPPGPFKLPQPWQCCPEQAGGRLVPWQAAPYTPAPPRPPSAGWR